MLGKLFKRKKPKEPPTEYDETAELEWVKKKTEFLESLLGKEHDIVMHAIIPFAVGSGLDLYYYPNGIPGTAIATRELADRHGNGPSNRVYPAAVMLSSGTAGRSPTWR